MKELYVITVYTAGIANNVQDNIVHKVPARLDEIFGHLTDVFMRQQMLENYQIYLDIEAGEPKHADSVSAEAKRRIKMKNAGYADGVQNNVNVSKGETKGKGKASKKGFRVLVTAKAKCPSKTQGVGSEIEASSADENESIPRRSTSNSGIAFVSSYVIVYLVNPGQTFSH